MAASLTDASPRRLYLAVGLCALIVHVGALWNRFALDDMWIIVNNPVVQDPTGWWRAFAEPYWPGNLTGQMYRPLVVASFALDRLLDGAAWMHAVNLLWHVAAAVAVAALARNWAGSGAALVAGLVFAVHPVHVEAVANIVGRSELMAAAFVLLVMYAGLVRTSPVWSAAALGAGLLSKENAAIAPALVVWAWIVGVAPRPAPRAVGTFVAAWALVAAGYAVIRYVVLHNYAGWSSVAPAFTGQPPLVIRLNAVAALADVARLLLFPLRLSADYSPDHRKVVTSLLDARVLLGAACLAAWAALLARCWRRGKTVEAFGWGWIGIAFLPVANLLFPTGVLVAERTLYLPSAGLAVALGAWGRDLDRRRLGLLVGAVVVAGGLRSAFRVPAWRDHHAVAMAMIEDAPASYRAWDLVAWEFLLAGQNGRALEAFGRAGEIYHRDARIYIAAADAAFTLGRYVTADSLLALADSACRRCAVAYRNQAAAAQLRGAMVAADSLRARARRLDIKRE
jgi:hypothetical protein